MAVIETDYCWELEAFCTGQPYPVSLIQIATKFLQNVWSNPGNLGVDDKELVCMAYTGESDGSLVINPVYVYDPGSTQNTPGIYVEAPMGVTYKNLSWDGSLAGDSPDFRIEDNEWMTSMPMTIHHYHNKPYIAMTMAYITTIMFLAFQQRFKTLIGPQLKRWLVTSQDALKQFETDDQNKYQYFDVAVNMDIQYTTPIQVITEAPPMKELVPVSHSRTSPTGGVEH